MVKCKKTFSIILTSIQWQVCNGFPVKSVHIFSISGSNIHVRMCVRCWSSKLEKSTLDQLVVFITYVQHEQNSYNRNTHFRTLTSSDLNRENVGPLFSFIRYVQSGYLIQIKFVDDIISNIYLLLLFLF